MDISKGAPGAAADLEWYGHHGELEANRETQPAFSEWMGNHESGYDIVRPRRVVTDAESLRGFEAYVLVGNGGIAFDPSFKVHLLDADRRVWVTISLLLRDEPELAGRPGPNRKQWEADYRLLREDFSDERYAGIVRKIREMRAWVRSLRWLGEKPL